MFTHKLQSRRALLALALSAVRVSEAAGMTSNSIIVVPFWGTKHQRQTTELVIVPDSLCLPPPEPESLKLTLKLHDIDVPRTCPATYCRPYEGFEKPLSVAAAISAGQPRHRGRNIPISHHVSPGGAFFRG